MNFTILKKRFATAVTALLMVTGFTMQAQNSCSGAQTVVAGTHTVSAINGTNIATSCSNASMAECLLTLRRKTTL